jgi:hypothetical protein
MAKDKFTPIDPSIVDQEDDTSEVTSPDPQQPQPAQEEQQDPILTALLQNPNLANILAIPPEQRRPDQQQMLAEAAQGEQERAQILLAQKAQQKLDAEAAKVKPGQDADRPGKPSILTPEEQAALAARDASTTEDAAVQGQANAENAVPTALKLPFMAAKGVMAAVDGANELVTGTKAYTSGAAETPDVGGTVGHVTKSIAQFTTGMVVSGGTLGAAGLVGGTAANVTRVALASGMSGSLFQDPAEQNLSNLLESNPHLRNFATEFLAAKPDDGEALARAKKFVENTALGAAGEGLIVGLRYLKALRGARAGEKGAKEAAEKIAKEELPQVMQSRGGVQNTRPLPGKEAEFAAVNRSLISPETADKLRASVDNTVTQANGGTHFNFEHLPDNYDAKSMINEVSKVVAPAIEKVTGGVQTLRETEDLAGILGQDTQKLIGQIATDAVGAKEQAARVVAGKSLMVDLASQISEQSRVVNTLVANSADSAAAEAKLLKLMNIHADLQVNLKGAITGAARTTSAGRIDVQEAARLFAMADGDPAAIAKLVRPQTLGTKIVNGLTEWRVNCLLSGVRTLATNVLSDVIQTTGLPLAKIVGGTLHRDLGIIKEGFSTYVGLSKSLGSAFKMARKALNDGHQNLIPGSAKVEMANHAIATTAKGPLGTMVNALGTAVRFPTRLIGTLDEFTKQLNYRAAVYAQASREGTAAGLTGKTLAAHIENAAARAFDEVGSGTNTAALKYAKEATFTQDLEYGIGKWLQQGANRHPIVRTILPFIKVPTNLFRQGWALTPGLQHLQRGFAEDLAAGGTRAATARGKQVLGAMMYAQAVNLATSGRITGAGPENAEARAALKATGWQPYSFVATNPDGTKEYTSYSRLDPFGMPFGLAADFAEVVGHLPDETASNVAMALTSSLAHNLTSKTYLGGMIDMLDAVHSPEQKGMKVAQSLAGSMVPNLRQFTDIRPETGDQYLREARTVLDGIRKKIPGLSQTLPPVRNLYGEAIHVPMGFGPDTITPFYESTGTNDKLLNELATFPKGFSMPSRMEGKVDLTTIQSAEGGYDAYDRLLQLNGSVKISGKNLKERLLAFIESDQYKKLTNDGPDYAGSKSSAINQIIGQHRTAALGLLRKENAAVKAALTQDRTNKAVALNKGPDGVVDINSFIQQFQQP